MILLIVQVVFISILVVALLLYALLYFRHNDLLNIKAKTVYMQKPLISENGEVKKMPIIKTIFHDDLILKEQLSRKAAYKNTTINIDDSFFNDSDMCSNYYLVVIYHKQLNIHLLTARYYYDKTNISKSLSGDKTNDITDLLNLETIPNGHIFLADRLSGNLNSSIYRKHRQYIFLLLYIEFLTHNTGKQFILMARKEKNDKLLKKYLHIGLQTIGSNIHKGKEHWILLGDVSTCEAKLKLTTLKKIILFYKKLIFNVKNVK